VMLCIGHAVAMCIVHCACAAYACRRFHLHKLPPALVKNCFTSPPCHGAVKVIEFDLASPSFPPRLDRVVFRQKNRIKRFYSSSLPFSCSGSSSRLFPFFGRRLRSLLRTDVLYLRSQIPVRFLNSDRFLFWLA
jgi:hypothetical protein